MPECVYVPNVSAGARRGPKRACFDPLEMDLCRFLDAMWVLRPEPSTSAINTRNRCTVSPQTE